VLGLLGEHTSQADLRLLLWNGLLAKLSQAAWLENTSSGLALAAMERSARQAKPSSLAREHVSGLRRE